MDLENNFLRQRAIYKYFSDRLIQGEPFESLLYHLFTHIVLNNHFDNAYYIKVNQRWELKQPITEIREMFWFKIKENFQLHKNKILSVLTIYLDEIKHSNIILVSFDHKYLVSIFTDYFDPDSFEDCYYINEYCTEIKAKGYMPDELDSLITRFSSINYLIFLKLIFNRIDYHELLLTYKNEEDIAGYKEEFVRNNFVINTAEDFLPINQCINEVMSCRYKPKVSLVEAIDIIIGCTLDKEPTLGFEVLCMYLHAGNQAKYWPVKTYKTIFNCPEIWHLKLYRIIYEIEFYESNVWKERYFFYLPAECVSTESISKLFDLYQNNNLLITLNANLLDKFIPFDNNLYKKVLYLLKEKRRANPNFKYTLDYKFFANHTFLVKDDLELCKTVYFQQEEIDKRFDFDCKEMIVFLKHDKRFFKDYLNFFYSKNDSFPRSYHKHFWELWVLPNTEYFFLQALLKINKNKSYYEGDNIASAFFIVLNEKNTERPFFLLQKLIFDYNKDLNILNLVFDIARNYMQKSYYVLICEFLTLNSDLAIFKKIRWLNNHFTSNGDSIWADFKVVELQKLHTTIQQLPDHLNYLPHLNEIEHWIEREQRESVRERKMRYRGFR